MRKYLSQAELLDLVANSKHAASDELRGALNTLCVELLSVTVARASDLLPTYKVRLSRWLKEGVPPSTGLEEFVAAMERCGESEVALTVHKTPQVHFMVLLRADLSTVLGMVAIRRDDDLTRIRE